MSLFKRKWVLILTVVLAVIVMLTAVLLAYASTAVKGDRIIKGVSASGVSLSGLAEQEAYDKLLEKVENKKAEGTVAVVLDGKKTEIEAADFAVGYDYKKTAEVAADYAKQGGLFKNFFKVVGAFFGGKRIPMEIQYNREALDYIITEMTDGVSGRAESISYSLDDDNKNLVVNTGKSGTLPDNEEIREDILEAVKNGNFDKEIEYKREQRAASPIDVDDLFDEVCTGPENAEYYIENNEIKIKEHKPGIEFDKAKAEIIINANRGENKTFSIPVKVTMPEITTEEVEKSLFKDALGSYKTYYGSSSANRRHNIELAAAKINGTILMPGAEFSYNGVVGKRTYDEGFADAHVYVNGEVVDGIGGGICQVSSTIYCAALYADLQITQRSCHMMTVSYVPLGQDATVDYGNIDFCFKNNTQGPIKIVATTGGGSLSVSVMGVKTDDKTVSLSSKTVGYVAPVETRIEDPSIPTGTEKVENEGGGGAVVELYKTVTVNGKSATSFVSKSRYSGSKRVIRVGTGEALPEETDSETAVETGQQNENPAPGTGTAEPVPSPEQTASPAPEIIDSEI